MEYSRKHVKQRMQERYGTTITDKEYSELCGAALRAVVAGQGIREKNGEDTQIIVNIQMKGQQIVAVWSTKEGRVKTVLPR